MKTKLFFFILLVSVAGGRLCAQSAGRECFDDHWKFHFGDLPHAEQPDFPDQEWRSLDLPHDWSIEGDMKPDHPAGVLGASLPGGIGWYRKSFTADRCTSKHRYITFDGVYMNSTVYLNGHELGHRPSGYTTFHYDLTPYLKDGWNVIAVRVDNSLQPNSRWYSGSGIYRHVWLTTTSPVHIDPWGPYVTTPRVSAASALVRIETVLINQGRDKANLHLEAVVLDPSGNKVAAGERSAQTAANGQVTVTLQLPVARPNLWDVDQPNLYRLVSRVYQGKELMDSHSMSFGIRTISFSPDSGFFLNNRWVKIKGVCQHHDLGCLGAAVHHRALARQLEILKGVGCNALRTSHNPPAPELLDLCDRMGFLVMVEAFDVWRLAKTKYDYHLYFDEWHERDLADMVLRDRNHPSVILWSIGNEIPEKNHLRYGGAAIAAELNAIIKRFDTTRYTTSAFAGVWRADSTLMTDKVDVIGINYTIERYPEEKAKHPNGLFIASETTSSLSSRGVYHFPADSAVFRTPDLQCSSFDHCATCYDRPWAYATQTTWRAVKETPYVAGLFVWTGFDYLGEPGYPVFPCNSSAFGMVDLCGFPKDVYYFYKSQWTDEPVLHLLPHWNWQQGDSIDVVAYTNCDEVKLFLNDRFLGAQAFANTAMNYRTLQWDSVVCLGQGPKLSLSWKVLFEPGALVAEGWKDGRRIVTDVVRTAGAARQIALSADRPVVRADGKDLSFITVEIKDAQGTRVPTADPLLFFSLTGEGRIAGVANGNPISLEPSQGRQRRAFNGLCQVVLQSTGRAGEIVLTVSSQGLPDETLRIRSE